MSKGETRIGGVRITWSDPRTNRRYVILNITATTGACLGLLTGFYYYGLIAGAILAILVDFIIVGFRPSAYENPSRPTRLSLLKALAFIGAAIAASFLAGTGDLGQYAAILICLGGLGVLALSYP